MALHTEKLERVQKTLNFNKKIKIDKHSYC